MTQFFRRNFIPLLLVLACVVAGASMAASVAAHARSLDEQQRRIIALNDEIKTNQETKSQIEHKVARQSLGVDPARVEKDTKTINDLLHRAMDWSSYAEYEQNRSEIMTKYHLDEKSSFMRSFLPPSPVTTDGEGKKYPYIDAAGLNSTLRSAEVEVTGTKGPAYNYAVMATVSSTSADDEATASRTSPVFLTINGNGQIKDLEGYAAKSGLRMSK